MRASFFAYRIQGAQSSRPFRAVAGRRHGLLASRQGEGMVFLRRGRVRAWSSCVAAGWRHDFLAAGSVSLFSFPPPSLYQPLFHRRSPLSASHFGSGLSQRIKNQRKEICLALILIILYAMGSPSLLNSGRGARYVISLRFCASPSARIHI